jgi:hypothetical protein
MAAALIDPATGVTWHTVDAQVCPECMAYYFGSDPPPELCLVCRAVEPDYATVEIWVAHEHTALALQRAA